MRKHNTMNAYRDVEGELHAFNSAVIGQLYAQSDNGLDCR